MLQCISLFLPSVQCGITCGSRAMRDRYQIRFRERKDSLQIPNHLRELRFAAQSRFALASKSARNASASSIFLKRWTPSPSGVKYGMPEMDEFDSDFITDFVESVLAGTAEPFFKSQPVPARQSGPVTVLVADNFHKLVRSPLSALAALSQSSLCPLR